jgi:glycosyltransferase involved in cell wall biosynthesis
MTDTAVVGVVIRTLNESELLGSCLTTLREQDGAFELDIVVVDSGSTDSTIEIARSHGARIIEMRPEDFDYSSALNAGLAQVNGALVVILSAHAIPIGDDWLLRMTQPFTDPRVAGVACRQVPWPDASWQEVHRLGHEFGDESRTFTAPGDDIVFSNSASAIRSDAWRAQPFTLPMAEDHDWATRVVAAGWTISYVADAVVHHSHREGPRAQAWRMIDYHRVLDTESHRRTLWRTIREAGGFIVRDGRRIVALEDQTVGRKLMHLVELLRMACYYVVDFSHSGTTAERRRAGSAS